MSAEFFYGWFAGIGWCLFIIFFWLYSRMDSVIRAYERQLELWELKAEVRKC